jgi:4-amino-4-deoxy-L-arabinose transferase-like glycosyltransferase
LDSARLLLVWAAAVFIFYSPSGSKLAPYILPMMPPLALLAGRHLAGVQPPRVGLAGSFVAAGVVAALLLALPTINSLLTPPPGQRAGYAQIARWGFGGGLLLAMATVQAWARSRFGVESLATRRERAVAILAIGMAGAFALLSNGTNAIETWRGAPDITATLRARLQPDTRLYCVDTYPQTVIFALANTCTTVRDHGELETQFDDGERNHLDTLDEFRAAWQADSKPLAVVDPRAWRELQQQDFAALVLFENPFAVVIARNP